jgi:hypothetical protein
MVSGTVSFPVLATRKHLYPTVLQNYADSCPEAIYLVLALLDFNKVDGTTEEDGVLTYQTDILAAFLFKSCQETAADSLITSPMET